MKPSTIARIVLVILALGLLVGFAAIAVLTAGWMGLIYPFGWIAFSLVIIGLIATAMGEFDK